MPVATAEESTGQQPQAVLEDGAPEGVPESKVGTEATEREAEEGQEGEDRNEQKARSWWVQSSNRFLWCVDDVRACSPLQQSVRQRPAQRSN